MTFLEEIVKDLKLRFNNDLEDLCLVFPNRRSSLFFLKYLKESSEKALWAPKVITINELFEELSSYRSSDKLSLLFDLFEVYQELYNEEETFDTFYFWGSMLLRDFDELDKYAVDAKYLFQNLSHHKELDAQFDVLTQEQKELVKHFWESYDKTDSEQKEQFVSLWERLYPIYEAYKKKLSGKQEGYEGMIYREVAELSQKKQLKLDQSHYAFIGFNALSRCEKILFASLRDQQKASFYWDVDPYYMDDSKQEAGLFLRWNSKEYPSPQSFVKEQNREFYLNQGNRFVDVYGVGGEIGQTQLIGDLIKQTDKSEYEQIAIVLPDEHLLLPTLHSIPEEVDKVNVSMGYPVRETPLYALFGFLVSLQQNITGEEKVYFKSKDVIGVLSHPYILYQDAAVVKEYVFRLRKGNVQWVSQEEIQGDLPELSALFDRIVTVEAMFDYLLSTLFQLYHSLEVEESVTLEQEYVYHFYIQISRLKDLLVNRKDLTIKIFLRLLNQFLQDLRVPFNGEPLEGLQVMGVLETRCLDFEHVYIMSMNEGALPATSVDSSFIPYNLRKGFGLPTIEEYDAVYAYYFYRLIQRAKKVTLLYNNATDGDMRAQVSRFVHQIKHEFKQGSVREKDVVIDLKVNEYDKKVVQKDEKVQKKLKQFLVDGRGMCERPLSPTAIDTYLRCGMQFYFKYILGLKEMEEVSEEIDPMQFGNLLHRSIELLYEPMLGGVVTETILKQSKSSIPKMIQTAVDELFSDAAVDAVNDGELKVVQNVLKYYLTKIVDMDVQYAPFELNGLEKKVSMDVSVGDEVVRFRGSIDRLDEKDGLVRVVDYKTGKVDMRVKSIEGLFEEDGVHNSYALQAMMYAIMYRKEIAGKKDVCPSLLPVKQLNEIDGVQSFEVFQEPDEELGIKKGFYRDLYAIEDDHQSTYEQGLKKWVEELFNIDREFVETEDVRTCDFCAYQSICKKDLS